MVKKTLKAPVSEQKICITCGLCCDGTLFGTAGLEAGEMGNLPENIEKNYKKIKDKEYFKLPCPYFRGKCTIYEQKKAIVCSSYRCQLLKDFAEKKVILHDALQIVRQAKQMRDRLMEQYCKISEKNMGINFRQLLLELGKIQKHASEKKPLSMDNEMLIASCNIFEALLIKHFRSAKDFNDMMVGNHDKQKI